MVRGDFKALMDQFLSMSDEEQQAALRGLSGELHASTTTTLLRTGERFFAASVDRQLSANRVGDGHVFWTDVVGFNGSLSGDGNAARASYGVGGMVGGVDLEVGRRARIGAALGYAHGSTELDGFGADEAGNHSVLPALYAEFTPGAWFVGGGLGYASHSATAVRHIVVGSTGRQAEADYRADQYSGLARAGRVLPSPSPMALRAIGELHYSTLRRESFAESGASSADLVEVGAFNTTSVRSVLGVRASWAPAAWGMRIQPEVQLGWAHQWRDTQGALTAALDGTRALAGFERFTVLGAPEGRDAARVTVGARTVLVGRGSAFASYDGNVTSLGSEHAFSAGVRFAW
jgi:uncharacterized protein with beta-barrel porin domain